MYHFIYTDSAQQMFTNVTAKNVEECVKTWLRRARERYISKNRTLQNNNK